LGGVFDQRLMGELRRVKIPPDLILQQNFRKPAAIECGLPPIGQDQGYAGYAALQMPRTSSKRRHNSFPGCTLYPYPPQQSRPQPPILIEAHNHLSDEFAHLFPTNNAACTESFDQVVFGPPSIADQSSALYEDIRLRERAYSLYPPTSSSSVCSSFDRPIDLASLSDLADIDAYSSWQQQQACLKIEPQFPRGSDPMMPCMRPSSAFDPQHPQYQH
jgi:hypothetical protein